MTVDRLRAIWPRLADDARRERPMLAALLSSVEPVGVDGSTVVVRALDPVHGEGLERQRDALGQLIARYATEPVRIKLEGAATGDRPTPQRPTRLTEEGARAERLKTLRAQDPGLNAAVDALDLELLE